MSKCPFCQQELKTFAKYKDGTSTVYCSKCNLFGDSKLFEELDRTRKALDKSIDLLKMLYADYNLDWAVVDSDKVYDFLEQINEITKGGRDE